MTLFKRFLFLLAVAQGHAQYPPTFPPAGSQGPYDPSFSSPGTVGPSYGPPGSLQGPQMSPQSSPGTIQPPPVPQNPYQRYFDTFAIAAASIVPSAPVLPSLAVSPQTADIFGQRYASNLSDISHRCPPNGMFGSFNPDHRAAVLELTDLYDDKPDLESMLEFSGFIKSRRDIHPHVWYASFMKAQAKRGPSYLSIHRPSAIDLFPSEFFPDVVLNSQDDSARPRVARHHSGHREKRQLLPPFPSGGRQCMVLDENIGRDNGPENALWYFREDVQLNAHHFIWHILFPTNSNQQIPRRGEFFYFVHHDLLARYRTERLSLGMTPVDPNPLFLFENTVLAEGYNAHMTDGVSTQTWVPRPANTPLNANTLNNDMLNSLRNLAVFRQRIIDILNTNTVVINGRQLPLTAQDNVNLFGELLEASVFSVNPNYYGQTGLHNTGHWVIANLRNNFPAGSMGVMGHSATAMRDIIFYRIHAGVESLFDTYKSNLIPPYQLTTGPNPLVIPGFQVSSLSVQSVVSGAPSNVLGTFWSFQNFTLEGGLDYNPNSASRSPNVNVCAKNLNHEEFTYSFQVNNGRNQAASAYIRIYMAPRFKSLNSQERYTMTEQRSLFFVMDSFVQPLAPGVNTITRRSIDSTLTAPWPRSIQQVRADIANRRTQSVNCECGFPHHLLLPRGAPGGMTFDLLVHVTDGAQDFVRGSTQANQCIPSHVHCGILGQPYPDAKPLGYPFDRRPYTVPTQVPSPQGSTLQDLPVPTLEAYVSNIPNMVATQVSIVHRNILI